MNGEVQWIWSFAVPFPYIYIYTHTRFTSEKPNVCLLTCLFWTIQKRITHKSHCSAKQSDKLKKSPRAVNINITAPEIRRHSSSQLLMCVIHCTSTYNVTLNYPEVSGWLQITHDILHINMKTGWHPFKLGSRLQEIYTNIERYWL